MTYRITFLSDKESWINNYLPKLIKELSDSSHDLLWIHNTEKIRKGDILFILSFSKILDSHNLSHNHNNIVVHASKLPKGKGWSPASWQVLEGKNDIPVTLFEAVSKVDSGKIYIEQVLSLDGTELLQEIHDKLGEITHRMCYSFVSQYPRILSKGKFQIGGSTYYPRRTPKDSELNLSLTLDEQFNALRIADNEKYPAFFIRKGHKYIIKIYKEETSNI